ncbi:dihydrofolate reductase family protein [Amycolatopsis acididurans]|uniref:dihydrofolate reductase family protein n=1 Tax=Amycolatopsis acididurans TaxID=2724524 RepID=UPI0028AAE057|nr:dihydrofolate reductase family protein [Amycolatopsis acididurans]
MALTAPPSWQGSALLAQPIEESVAALKDRHREVHVIGSLNLVQSLLRFGLVDRLDLWVDPVVLGTGKKVFGDGMPPTALRLIESTGYSNGTLHLAYDTAGEPAYGTIG